MLTDLISSNLNSQCPIFEIAGVQWSGSLWGYENSRWIEHTREDGGRIKICDHSSGGAWLEVTRPIALDVNAKKSSRHETIESAAHAGLATAFETREAAGVIWFVERDEDDYKNWVAAFGDNDEGKIHWFGRSNSRFHCDRTVEIAGRTMKIEHYGIGLTDDSMVIATFEDAAVICASLFDIIINARSGDAFANGYAAGRSAIKNEIEAL